MSKNIRFSIFLIGCNAVIVQTVLIRELAQVFFGTELLIGLGLALWLLWGAAGAACFRVKSGQRAWTWFLALLVLSAALFPGQILLVRAIRVITGSPAGQLLGAGRLLLFSLLAIAPTAFANGALFSLALSLNKDNPRGFSLVYRWDVWGGVSGGLAGGLVLIPHVPAFAIAQIVGLLFLAAALLLALHEHHRVFTLISLACLISFSLLVFIPFEIISVRWLFPGQKIVATGVSKYSQLAVIGNEGQYSLYQNGQLAAVWPDAAGAEERCLIPLSLVRLPARVLMIGSGFADLALLSSLPGIHMSYCEIDRASWRLFCPFTGKTAPGSVDLQFTDFRAFVNRYRGPKYDLVLVNLPDPYSACVNRGYTSEFFAGLRAILADSGVVRLSVASNENYLSPPLRALDGSIMRTVAGCFDRTALLVSGDRLAILASPKNSLIVEPDSVMARLRHLGVTPAYLSRPYLASKILPDRIGFIREQLGKEIAPVNRDLRPVGYAYQLTVSSLMQRNSLVGALFSRVTRTDWRVLLLLALPFLIPVFKPRTMPACAALVAGFAGMSAQMAILLAFQALQGYVYPLVALISACYLAGLALGGSLRSGAGRSLVLPLLGMFAALVMLIPLGALRLPPLLQVTTFGGISALTGLCGGWALTALASRDPHGAVVLYAFDLAGGALGGICFSLWWLPAFGQQAALLAVAAMVLAAILLILPLTSPAN